MNIDPAAEYVYLSGCTGLTALPELPAAKTVDLSGCTGLTALWIETRLHPLLTATGKSVPEILATGCWECHDWNNCPMHAVFGANGLEDVPAQWRGDASIFVSLFDANAIPRSVVEKLAPQPA